MISEVQARINRLKLSIRLLEDHLRKFGNKIQPRPLYFIRNQIDNYKRELQIRVDYPF
jgi:hypothetical protein